MSDWLHNLPVMEMALVVFGVTYLVAAAIYACNGPRGGGSGALFQGYLRRYAIAVGYYLRIVRGVHRCLGMAR
jgi:hypothetical protein